ncbi:MAG: cytochrome c oxidase accessory protein CcoG [Myxococcota bacterium]
MSLFSGTREWIYTWDVGGRWSQVHRWSGRLFVWSLFVLPWLSWGGQPLVRADLPARRLYFIGQVFTAADGFLLVLGALVAAFGLFFISSVFGRIWCGFLCPQTVLLEEWVRRVESWVEGSAPKRRRRDAGPWTFDKIWRKTAKVVILTGLAIFLGMTVLSYFTGPVEIWTGQGGTTAYVLVGLVTGGMLADWLWFREQLCIYLCPYARFQSALVDEHSLSVSFNPDVEIKPGKKSGQAGNCIDCRKCVTACPMGIDIRDGFHLECITCARCVDACTAVMTKFDQPSLVRWSTYAADAGKKTQYIRPRTVIYGTIITGIAAALLGMIMLHNPIEVSLNRSPGTMYQVDYDGFVRNTYLLRVVNNDAQSAHTFAVTVEGLEHFDLSMPELVLEAGEDRTVPLILRIPTSDAKNFHEIAIKVDTGSDVRMVETTFRGPSGENS